MLPKKGIVSAFIADGGGWSVAGINNGFVGQDHEFSVNALYQTFVAAAGEVGSANAGIK
jgi:hypothetical protein